jgi:asparagine synthase (glutamine-hydrolysing)
MCGLSGIYSPITTMDNKLSVEASITSLLHRGPDGVGFYADGNATLGHCRLAFKGQSPNYPVKDFSKRYHIGLNGEIYNYKLLAKEFGIANSIVEEGGDAVVVVELYKMLGDKCIELLDGHFAFYIYDSDLQELHLYRDRFGSKPLYYLNIGKNFYFSSEVKSLPVPDSFNREINLDTLNLYFRTQNFYGSDTIFKNIFIVEPGQHLRIDENGITFNYFFVNDAVDRNLNLPADSVTEIIEKLLLDSVSNQWEPNIEMAGYLSGGVDSSLIALSAKRLGFDYKTYTTKFTNSLTDESNDAKLTASKLQFQNITTSLDEDTFWNKVLGISKIVEEPRFGQCINNLVSMQALSASSRIAMSGIGADELFGGYPWRYFFPSDSLRSPSDLRRLLIEKQCRLSNSDIVLNSDGDYPLHRLDAIVGESVESVGSENLENAGIYAALNLDLKHWLPSLLVVEDKLSMSLGIETRMPFLTNDFWQLGRQLGAESMLGGSGNIEGGKLPLRALLKNWGFAEIATRPKQGFSAPDNVWFGETKAMNNIFRKNNPLWDLLDRSQLINTHREHIEGAKNHRGLLWSTVYLDDFIAHW